MLFILFQHPLKYILRYRLAITIALSHISSYLHHKLRIILRLHAFTDHLGIQVPGQIYDIFHNLYLPDAILIVKEERAIQLNDGSRNRVFDSLTL